VVCSCVLSRFFSVLRRPPTSTPFPYTTLFRSHGGFKYLTRQQAEALKDDPLIDQYGMRRFLGMPMDVPFNKSHVEVSWCDENERSEEHTSELQSRFDLVCRLLL